MDTKENLDELSPKPLAWTWFNLHTVLAFLIGGAVFSAGTSGMLAYRVMENDAMLRKHEEIMDTVQRNEETIRSNTQVLKQVEEAGRERQAMIKELQKRIVEREK